MSTPTSSVAAVEHTAHTNHSVKGYLFVFFALIIGTVFTVWASFIDLGHHWNIVLALVIACVKAFLVAGYFMHLVTEKKLIYTVLGFTAFFFTGLMYLTLWSMQHESLIHWP
jgi:cytochrome c oxidase subunit 4